jgi:hypothetical protein
MCANMQTLRLAVRALLPAVFFAALALPACSSNTEPTDADDSADELGASCGGIANLKCSAGRRCVITETYPDAMGNCYRQCGGIAGIQCPASLTCVLDGTYPDASGTCRAPSRATCATTRCAPGTHCEEKGLNGGSPVPVCLKNAEVHCNAIRCSPGYHCEEKGLNGGSTGVCIENAANVHCTTIRCKAGYHCEEKGLNGGSVGVCLEDDAPDAG